MTDHTTRNLNKARSASGPALATAHAGDETETVTRPCLRCGEPMFSALALASTVYGPFPIFMGQRVGSNLVGTPRYAGSNCFALICRQCGYTELYTMRPDLVEGAAP